MVYTLKGAGLLVPMTQSSCKTLAITVQEASLGNMKLKNRV
jgi:hypothetical protein